MNPDGVSYLDMGDQYWKGNVAHCAELLLVASYGLADGIHAFLASKPTIGWEFPEVHMLNFVDSVDHTILL